MKSTGKLIVIDGSDGAGKSTQVALLIARLRGEGRRVETMNFPQDKNFFGSLIRESLAGKHGDFIGTDPYLVSTVYAADRFESKSRLEKWIQSGAIVVLDRYVSANQMHQGGKIKNDKERAQFLKWLDRMEHEIFGIPRPDLIMYLHVPVARSQKLLKKRGSRDLAEKNISHLKNTEKSALLLAATSKKWVKVVCADRSGILSREAIHEEIYKVVAKTVGL